MLNLYPDIHPFATHRISVEEPHELYVEQYGNPNGLPVVFLHGGPGAGTTPRDARYFDPNLYHIILFDQRGAGKSTPHASLEKNTTLALVADIEQIRNFFGIERWLVFGGSWGSTLALAYAEAYPASVRALILRGIFLCRQQDIDWFYQDGASHIFPDYWEYYEKIIPLKERGNFLEAYYSRLTGADEVAQMAAAKAWSIWEGQCATLRSNSHLVERFSHPHLALSLARIEAHYFKHHIFLEENQLLNQAHKLANIPGIIIHGRYDMVCPIDNAFALKKAWPNADLQIIPDAGHAAVEPGIIDALVRATQFFAKNEL